MIRSGSTHCLLDSIFLCLTLLDSYLLLSYIAFDDSSTKMTHNDSSSVVYKMYLHSTQVLKLELTSKSYGVPRTLSVITEEDS